MAVKCLEDAMVKAGDRQTRRSSPSLRRRLHGPRMNYAVRCHGVAHGFHDRRRCNVYASLERNRSLASDKALKWAACRGEQAAGVSPGKVAQSKSPDGELHRFS